MIKEKIEVDLFSLKSIRQAQKKLRDHKRMLHQKVVVFANRLAEQGYKEAQINIMSYNAFDTGELLDSLVIDSLKRWDKGRVVFYVRADSKYAMFVEFGTGYVGKDNPYKYTFPEGLQWNYVSGKQILENAKYGLKGWFYPTDDGAYKWTEGQKSRPYLTDAIHTLYEEVNWIAEEVFR